MVPPAPDPRLNYLSGATPFFALQADQRFPYCLYVPTDHSAASAALPLVVIQHGTPRTAMACRDRYIDFAETHRCIVLAPLFPAGIAQPGELDGYKLIGYLGVRYDDILLAMVDEVGQLFNARTERIYLHGFSGGGQFAHRFYYLHPTRLAALSIGAPGRITQLDDTLPWWLGTRDFAERFAVDIDLNALRAVPVHLVAGADDLDTHEINNLHSPDWMAGAALTGGNRIERLRTLQTNLEGHGISVQFDLVPGVAHDDRGITPAVQAFLRKHLRTEIGTTQ